MIRICLLSADAGGRAAVVHALERGGCAVVGEGRTAEDARRLAAGCDLFVVDDDEELVAALVGSVRRPVVALDRRGDVQEPDDPAALRIAWPTGPSRVQRAVRQMVELAGGPLPAGSPRAVTTSRATTPLADITPAAAPPPATTPPATTPPAMAPPATAPAPPAAARWGQRPRPRIVVLGASAGGPAAIATVLAAISVVRTPILIAQHLHPDFAASMLAFLSRAAGMPVVDAQPGLRLDAGVVALAGPSGDLTVAPDGRCVVRPSAGPHVPSVDALLRSVAAVYGPASAGVILTGMGADGAQGLMDMRSRGALTIAQDRATSTVYGMPAAATAAGAAELVLPLEEIGPAIRTAVGTAS